MRDCDVQLSTALIAMFGRDGEAAMAKTLLLRIDRECRNAICVVALLKASNEQKDDKVAEYKELRR